MINAIHYELVGNHLNSDLPYRAQTQIVTRGMDQRKRAIRAARQWTDRTGPPTVLKASYGHSLR